MSKHTIGELRQMQSLSLNAKIAMTKARIKGWVEEFGEDGVYVSFSGGKDSTVLLTIAREIYPDIKAVFVDTGLEYPEIRQFVKTWDNVEWLKPKKNFKQVIEDYGYPFISKEVSEKIYYAQKYLTWYKQQNSLDRPTDRPNTDYWNLFIQEKAKNYRMRRRMVSLVRYSKHLPIVGKKDLIRLRSYSEKQGRDKKQYLIIQNGGGLQIVLT